MEYVALKGFMNGTLYQKRGRSVSVDGERAKELLRAGLIAEATAEKEAPAPKNKMAPAPKNKEAKG